MASGKKNYSIQSYTCNCLLGQLCCCAGGYAQNNSPMLACLECVQSPVMCWSTLTVLHTQVVFLENDRRRSCWLPAVVRVPTVLCMLSRFIRMTDMLCLHIVLFVFSPSPLYSPLHLLLPSLSTSSSPFPLHLSFPHSSAPLSFSLFLCTSLLLPRLSLHIM